MKITIESTGQLTTVDGIEVRAWNGRTGAGVECTVFVRRIAVLHGQHEQFERELRETAMPEELGDPRFIPLRHIL